MTLSTRIARSRQAFAGSISTIKERIKSYFKKFIKNHNLYTRMASIAILGALVPISVIPVFSANDQEVFKSKIVLDKNGKIVDVSEKKIAIVPGESQAQTEARLAAEAAAAAQAAASAKTVRVAQAPKVYSDPANFDGIYQSAGAIYGIDWRILKAVHYVETGGSGSTSKKSYAGATGPMQFLPSTWRSNGQDGNGDGIKDITNVNDAIYGAAYYLAVCGGSANNYRDALWGYNRSTSYYYKVMDVARSLGF